MLLTTFRLYLFTFAIFQYYVPNPLNLETELDEWKVYWNRNLREDKNIPDTIAETLLSMHHARNWFPNIYRILCLIAVVPASSNSCERSMSTLRVLKNYLRSTMTQERFSSLALAYINRDINIDAEQILDLFAKDFPHRLQLTNILDV